MSTAGVIMACRLDTLTLTAAKQLHVRTWRQRIDRMTQIVAMNTWKSTCARSSGVTSLCRMRTCAARHSAGSTRMSVRAASTSYSAAANYAALRSNMASLVATPVSGYAGRWRRTRWRDGASGAAPVRVPDEASAEEGDILYAFRDKPGAQELAQARDSYQHISARAAAQRRAAAA